jgi:tRNA threonylcarbamoyl adenosine modification protein YjeE
MPSPTFNLLYRYDAPDRRAELFHLDLYRLTNAEEVWELGWSELGESNQIVLIEWPERAEHVLPASRWDVTLTVPDPAADVRELRAARRGDAPALPLP